MTAEDLTELVERAQDGDRDAVEAVLTAVTDDIHRLALRMTGDRDDVLDATQEILVKVLTRLSTFQGQAAFTTWVHRVAVNHLLDRKRSAVERYEMTFGAFADDLHDGLTAQPNSGPELDVLAREVKHGCTLALLTCLDRQARVAYLLGEVFGVSSHDGAWICEISEPAYRQRLTRARTAVRQFVTAHCGLVSPDTARLPLPTPCHRRRQTRPDRPSRRHEPDSRRRQRGRRRNGTPLRHRRTAPQHPRPPLTRPGRRPHPRPPHAGPLPAPHRSDPELATGAVHHRLVHHPWAVTCSQAEATGASIVTSPARWLADRGADGPLRWIGTSYDTRHPWSAGNAWSRGRHQPSEPRGLRPPADPTPWPVPIGLNLESS